MKVTGEPRDVFFADLTAAGEDVRDRGAGDASCSRDFGAGYFFGFDQVFQRFRWCWFSTRTGLDLVAFD